MMKNLTIAILILALQWTVGVDWISAQSTVGGPSNIGGSAIVGQFVLPPHGLISWWKMCGDISATSGCVPSASTVVYDTKAVANGTWHGSQSGSSYYYSTGFLYAYGGAFNSGNSNYIPATYSSLTSYSSMTLCARFNANSSWPSYAGLFDLVGATTSFGVQKDGSTNALIAVDSQTHSVIGGTVTTGAWHFTCVIENAGGTAYLYLDSNAPVSFTALSALPSGASTMEIGYITPGGTHYFYGTEGCVMLFNVAISALTYADLNAKGC